MDVNIAFVVQGQFLQICWPCKNLLAAEGINHGSWHGLSRTGETLSSRMTSTRPPLKDVKNMAIDAHLLCSLDVASLCDGWIRFCLQIFHWIHGGQKRAACPLNNYRSWRVRRLHPKHTVKKTRKESESQKNKGVLNSSNSTLRYHTLPKAARSLFIKRRGRRSWERLSCRELGTWWNESLINSPESLGLHSCRVMGYEVKVPSRGLGCVSGQSSTFETIITGKPDPCSPCYHK